MSTSHEIYGPKRCQHIMDNGRPCASPALRGFDFCYWHQRASRNTKPESTVIPILENGHSIQLATTQVLRLLIAGKITPQAANAAFYGLQVANSNGRCVVLSGREATVECTPAMLPLLTGAPPSPGTNVEEKTVELAPAAGPGIHSHLPDNLAIPDDRSIAITEEDDSSVDASPPSPSIPLTPKSPQSTVRVPHASPKAARPLPTLKHRPPDDFLAAPVAFSNKHPLREQRYPAEAIRAYWTQHLPSEVINLEHGGEPVYHPPTWLPLTEEEVAYLRDHRDIDECRERLVLHGTHHFVEPPAPESIIETHRTLNNPDSDSMTDLLLAALKEFDCSA